MSGSMRSVWLLPAAAFLLAACGGEQGASSEQAAANPCNPCAAANPCNPCGANPCAGAKPTLDAGPLTQGDRQLNTGGKSDAQLVAMGEKLWNDKTLSKSGSFACANCHIGKYKMMNATFAKPYPHMVKMAHDKAGMAQVSSAEMVQLCMVVPMQSDPLPWNSVKLTALSRYIESLQPGFKPMAAAGMNPCNPCGANPCAGANPCNPCAANPCAGAR